MHPIGGRLPFLSPQWKVICGRKGFTRPGADRQKSKGVGDYTECEGKIIRIQFKEASNTKACLEVDDGSENKHTVTQRETES